MPSNGENTNSQNTVAPSGYQVSHRTNQSVIPNVPILFRLKDCIMNEGYIFFIRQLEPSENAKQDAIKTPLTSDTKREKLARSKSQMKSSLFNKIKYAKCADLTIYVSNKDKNPNEKNHDLMVCHNNIKCTSRTT